MLKIQEGTHSTEIKISQIYKLKGLTTLQKKSDLLQLTRYVLINLLNLKKKKKKWGVGGLQVKKGCPQIPPCTVHTRRTQHCAYEGINKRQDNPIISYPVKLPFEYEDNKHF